MYQKYKKRGKEESDGERDIESEWTKKMKENKGSETYSKR